MSLQKKLAMLSRYSAWANERLYNALAALPAPILEAPRPHRPDGLLGVLSHICVVDQIWKANLEGRDHGFAARKLAKPLPLADVTAQQVQLDRWYADYAAACDETRMDESVAFKFVGGQAATMGRGDMLLHVVNHKTYHRGYVADMLYESGARPPTLDLSVYVRDVAQP